jgi:5-methylcytosine-specific restriction endonuclease McrA
MIDSSGRSVDEWIGKTPDSPIPPKVKLRVFQAYDGVCPKCSRQLQPRKWECDHIVALINGGENRESNLQPLCKSPCHSQKTKVDAAEKSRVYRRAAAHLGIKRRKGPPMPGSKESGWKRKIDGTLERRR